MRTYSLSGNTHLTSKVHSSLEAAKRLLGIDYRSFCIGAAKDVHEEHFSSDERLIIHVEGKSCLTMDFGVQARSENVSKSLQGLEKLGKVAKHANEEQQFVCIATYQEAKGDGRADLGGEEVVAVFESLQKANKAARKEIRDVTDKDGSQEGEESSSRWEANCEQLGCITVTARDGSFDLWLCPLTRHAGNQGATRHDFCIFAIDE